MLNNVDPKLTNELKKETRAMIGKYTFCDFEFETTFKSG